MQADAEAIARGERPKAQDDEANDLIAEYERAFAEFEKLF
jgi:hypothetical protein